MEFILFICTFYLMCVREGAVLMLITLTVNIFSFVCHRFSCLSNTKSKMDSDIKMNFNEYLTKFNLGFWTVNHKNIKLDYDLNILHIIDYNLILLALCCDSSLSLPLYTDRFMA